MSWDSRSKLNFAQYFKQIHIHTHTHTHALTHRHTHTIRVPSQKRENFEIIPRGPSGGMVDDASVLL
jgi:hypothetical protein